MELAYSGAQPATGEVVRTLESAGFAGAVAQVSGDDTLLVRFAALSEDDHQKAATALKSLGAFDELKFDSIGPAIGQELAKKSTWALILILVSITVYVAWAFRGISHKVNGWKYGALTVLVGLHDILLPMGVFAVLGSLRGATIGTAFVAAILTILGYSINDTIVVFDRVRETLTQSKASLNEIIDTSVRQTFARSMNTTLTTLLTLVAVFIFGGESTRDFALALLVGIASGAYSSIFLAAPLLWTWQKWEEKRAA